MRFALLGDHADGLAMARALAESGRHELAAYAGPAVGAEYLRGWNLTPAVRVDAEEVLADPSIQAVIIAGRPGNRAALLRRALQSERHVLCVHPADHRPDTAYEAATLQRDTARALFPLLPESLHPALGRLCEVLADAATVESRQARRVASAIAAAPALARPQVEAPRAAPTRALPMFRMIEFERWSSEAVLLDADIPGHRP